MRKKKAVAKKAAKKAAKPVKRPAAKIVAMKPKPARAAVALEDPELEDEFESGDAPEPLDLFPPDPAEANDDEDTGGNW